MLNRIRRAVARTRARYVSKGRHRRRLAPSRPLGGPASSSPVDRPTVALGLVRRWTSHHYLLRGEDVALVRPYVLVGEKRVGRHPMDVAVPNTSADTRPVFLGVG